MLLSCPSGGSHRRSRRPAPAAVGALGEVVTEPLRVHVDPADVVAWGHGRLAVATVEQEVLSAQVLVVLVGPPVADPWLPTIAGPAGPAGRPQMRYTHGPGAWMSPFQGTTSIMQKPRFAARHAKWVAGSMSS